MIEKILKQLTPERIKKELAEIQAVELPNDLQNWVDEYNKVGDRDPFIWKWAYKISLTITPKLISNLYYSRLIKDKFILIMFVILIDDVIDLRSNVNLLKIIECFCFKKGDIQEHKLNAKNKNYLLVVKRVWKEFQSSLEFYPNYKKLKQIINFDIYQIVNGLYYSNLVTEFPFFFNEEESKIYESHAIPAIVCFMLDILCANEKTIQNTTGYLREMAFHLQIMGRIDNWLATAERELNERGRDNPIILTVPGYSKSEIIKKLLKNWDIHYQEAKKITHQIKFPQQLFSALSEDIARMHFISRGFI